MTFILQKDYSKRNKIMEGKLIQIGAFTFKLTRGPNGTYLSEPLPQEEEGSISLIPKEDKVLVKFESISSPGTFHYVRQSPGGTIYCSCPGFGYRKTCKHVNFIKEKTRITAPIKITQKKEVNRE